MAENQEEQTDHLVVLLRRLKHDLGKYITLRQRWLAPDADEQDRRQALADDVLRTRQGPDGVSDAVQVWLPFRAVLVGEEPLSDGVVINLSQDQDVIALEQGVQAAMQGATGGDLSLGLQGAKAVQRSCTALMKRAIGGELG